MWSVPGSQPWSRNSPRSLPIREDLWSFDSELASDKIGARGRLVIPPSHGGGNGHHLLLKPSPAPQRLRPVPQLPHPAAARPPPSRHKCSITVSDRGRAAEASEEDYMWGQLVSRHSFTLGPTLPGPRQEGVVTHGQIPPRVSCLSGQRDFETRLSPTMKSARAQDQHRSHPLLHSLNQVS